MLTLFVVFCLIFGVAMVSAVIVTEIRTYRARLRCYRRHALASLTRAAKRNAIRRFYGGAS